MDLFLGFLCFFGNVCRHLFWSNHGGNITLEKITKFKYKKVDLQQKILAYQVYQDKMRTNEIMIMQGGFCDYNLNNLNSSGTNMCDFHHH